MGIVKNLTVLFFVILSLQVTAQEAPVFPKGEMATNTDNFTGTIWLNEFVKADSSFDFNITGATYKQASILDWHMHPGGQILLITAGSGYYQEKGKPVQIVHKGDVIKCTPGVEHWHGATQNSDFAYVAISPAQKGKTIWSGKVSREAYNQINHSDQHPKNDVQEIIRLSTTKWHWMADRQIDSLDALFHEKAVFVHMGGTMTRMQELQVIKTGSIQYKQADIQETTVQLIGNTAILLSKIRLLAVVGGHEVTNPFVVTEVYIKEENGWSLGSLSFTRLLTK
ncbi:DUF4440 domain-containing protein [Chitinophaga nivalis]|uniref:DUF4440 domain-containing protein n=1 Tax=Chitinophaga nivalis TaxID=2991709 RepID=A0ABT3IMZ0_9BACT|nr:DUF4440 domain-containing protein [Chitinophaga nivalis]MCW3465153.1 DUF4440 domain-containing protein [Chitinophaga nivalis]MCW3485155.1 DUF4440 domain-containing protein [Chitinophaga nivalis]